MIVFVVLHYKNMEDTLTCLSKLKKFNCHVVVVDNNTFASGDEEKIKTYTSDIIKLDKNLGFSKANNIGVQYAKTKYNPDFYAVINSDLFIDDINFVDLVKTTYNKYKFDILGPHLDSPSGESKNPFPVIYGSKNITKEISNCNKLISIYESTFKYFLLNMYLKIKKVFKKKIIEEKDKLQLEVPLHGCCLIFSKKYINKYENAFDDRVFLFHEEEFLYRRIKKDKLVSVYNPDIKVFHKEGASLKSSFTKEREAKLFREKERKKSLNILLKD